MTDAIIAHEKTVELRSDPLDQVWWQGRQWAVTSHGIECRDGTYSIDGRRLHERYYFKGAISWSWPSHLAEKGWVDIHDFCTAFAVAIALHPCRKGKAYRRGEVRQVCGDAIEQAGCCGVAA